MNEILSVCKFKQKRVNSTNRSNRSDNVFANKYLIILLLLFCFFFCDYSIRKHEYCIRLTGYFLLSSFLSRRYAITIIMQCTRKGQKNYRSFSPVVIFDRRCPKNVVKIYIYLYISNENDKIIIIFTNKKQWIYQGTAHTRFVYTINI